MSTGLLEQRVNYPNTQYEYGYGGGGGSDADGNNLKEIDCSHLLHLMLKDASYIIPYRTTSQLRTDTTHYDTVALADVQPGDIALWTGSTLNHTGVIETIGVNRDRGEFFGSQNNTGPKSARFGVGAPFWPMPTLYLRPKPEFRTGDQTTPSAPAPAPAAESPKAQVKPTLNFEYPIRNASGQQYSEAEELFALLEKESSGRYLLGNHGFWHGGIHFSEASAPQCVRQHPVRCIADGEVVAYRLNNDYLESTYTGSAQCTNLRYSSSFCLIRHEYYSPPNPAKDANKDKQNSLVFYSLYMHLLPYSRYAPEEEKGPQRVKVINGGWPARNLPMGEPGSEVLGEISNGTEFVILEERDGTDNSYRFSRGRIAKGKVGEKKEGDEVWFASQQNGQPIQNNAGKQRLQNVPAIERIRPGYWQGKVRATVSTLNGIKVRSAPSGEKGGPQLAPNQVLCPGSVVEFDSDKVRWLQLEDDKNYPMAECIFVPGQGGLKGGGTLPATFWLCVDDTGKGKMVNHDSIIPSSFDSVVTLKTAIKAGDPIGYMGLYETPTATGGRAGKHQVHIEVFSGDAQLQAFLENQAKLEQGRKHLRLPAGTELFDRSILDANSSPFSANSYQLKREHVVPVDKSPSIKDSKGQEWYQVTVLENRQSIAGLVKKPTDSSSDLEIIYQYDLKKHGFRIVEEQNENADGFLDKDNMPAFFKELYNEIDSLGDANGEVSPQELKTALHDPDLRERWSKLIALHPTEWQAKSSDTKWQRLNALLKDNQELLKHEQRRIDDLVFWDEVKTAELKTAIHHLHPIAFIHQLKKYTPVSGVDYTVEDGKSALRIIYDKYGKDMAVIIERMYRDETRHFQSMQYRRCGTGGMEAFGEPPYYGWDASFFEANQDFTPIGIWEAFENQGMSGQGGNQQVTDHKKRFVVLPSVLAGMEYKANYINKHGGNWARWHSTDTNVQTVYRTHIEAIRARFVNEFEGN
ncbi:hypothetical protein F3I62_01920 [Pseudomonas sp. R-28-1W-6]|uniref:hypothetical protein n=1 Tax=Pseudomonas sp. R-28-1W-6 TaxID=2650101 RepID=UPI001365EBFF|nr:hypothetical protein [Pseudomonas sp. R-28-1W-6]MWV10838.1 hypothetical protein [Pseudomonas sp. R-28-1W-6]